MTAHSNADWAVCQRVERYLVVNDRDSVTREYTSTPEHLWVWIDVDHAGCRERIDATSDGVVMTGRRGVKGWRRTQAVLAWSSG